MDALLTRYFDGDLSDSEARAFLDAVEASPELEKELRAYERTLVLGKKLPTPEVPADFTKRVMVQVTSGTHPRGGFVWPAFLQIRWATLATATVAAAVAFIGGWWMARDTGVAPLTRTVSRAPVTTTAIDVSPMFVSQASMAGNGSRYVRLAYVPTDPSVESVTVAGDFNGWDPESTHLRRQNGAWTTILVLPAGNYEYMFVEDGTRWVTDPLAVETREDGFGGMNAVLDVEL